VFHIIDENALNPNKPGDSLRSPALGLSPAPSAEAKLKTYSVDT